MSDTRSYTSSRANTAQWICYFQAFDFTVYWGERSNWSFSCDWVVYKDSAHFGFSHSTTNCHTATFHVKVEVRNPTCLKDSGKNHSPQPSCLLTQRLRELSFLWNIYLSIKFSWNQRTGWKASGICTFTHTTQSCIKLISRANQANNKNLISSFSPQIAKLAALESEFHKDKD